MVKLFISNTDNRWFDFLKARAPLADVNFWQPSATNFRSIGPGEFFVFRLKSPRNVIGGFGVLSNASLLPIQTAWDAFGISNGVSDINQFMRFIQDYRPDERITPQSIVGCRVLTQPVFLNESRWKALPASWSQNIVGGKSYNTDEPEGGILWEELDEILESHQSAPGFAEAGPRFGGPHLVKPRLGQGSFRVSVIEAYHRQCGLTDGRVLPALEAAHIRPYAIGGVHSRSNGILLRRDIHAVFDAGYAMFDDDYRFVVSSRVKEVFDNGHEYRRLHGTKLRLPDNPDDYPKKEHFRWHADEKFEK